MPQWDRDLQIKKWDPRILLQSGRNSLLAWIGVGATNLTLNSIASNTGAKPFTNVKTIRKVIGAVGVSGCDYNFATADGVSEQPIDLGAIIPAFARILDAKTVTQVAFAHAATAIASWACATNVITIVTQAAHGLVSGNSVVIAGMTEAVLNGTRSITRVDNTTFTFSLTHGDAGTTPDTTGTVTFSAMTFVAETGTQSSGNELIASATIKAANAVTYTASGFLNSIAPSATAKNVWLSATPNGKWNHITAGKVAVYITYIDI